MAATMITRKFLGRCRSVSGNPIYHLLQWHLGGWRSIAVCKEISPKQEGKWCGYCKLLRSLGQCGISFLSDQTAHLTSLLWYSLNCNFRSYVGLDTWGRVGRRQGRLAYRLLRGSFWRMNRKRQNVLGQLFPSALGNVYPISADPSVGPDNQQMCK